MRRRTVIGSIMLAATGAAGCAKHPPAAAPAPVVAVNQDSIARARAYADSVARADAARRQAAARAQARADSERAARERALAMARDQLVSKIYFDYDKSDLTDADGTSLDHKVGILNANGAVKLRVDGNTDERGSAEYNLALGQRRAAAAKRYLTQHGVTEDRVEIISYGEDRPVCQGHDESCWSQNRRDEFEVTAGAVTSPGTVP